MLGFETIGNATLTVFDEYPVLCTDPWIDGNPYFGSWGHPFDFPVDQIENIKQCKFVWFSHGHPDHLIADSFHHFENATVLVPDHCGDRIFNELVSKFKCVKVKSNEWFKVSDNVRIKSFADWNQDAAILVDIGGKDAVLNSNDGSLLGWKNTIRSEMKNYENKFLLRLANWGDADMINIYDEDGVLKPPPAASQPSIGQIYSRSMESLGCNFSIPFSSFHRYVRSDSAHMNSYVAPLDRHYDGFDSKTGELLPAFIRWDTTSSDFKKIPVTERSLTIVSPETYGDNYSDALDEEDKEILALYIRSFSKLKRTIGKVIFITGGEEFGIKISNAAGAISFEVPRTSLMTAVRYEVFDDLLIGNFMKTTLHNVNDLYPDFSPTVAKYGDNGRAKTEDELRKYFSYYRANSANYWRDMLQYKSEEVVRRSFSPNSPIYTLARHARRKLFP